MVTLTRIYTRGGDSGQTSLGRGDRVAKHDTRVEAYGTTDEANSIIGLARSAIASTASAGARRAEAAKRIPAGLLSFMGESRRLSNQRVKRELRVKLRYPTVIDGLAEAAERQPRLHATRA